MPTAEDLPAKPADTFIAQRSLLRNAAQRMLGNRELAEDVVQEAYIKLLESAHSTPVEQPVAYCFQVVRRLAIDRLRRLSLEAHLFAAEEEGIGVHAPTGSPEHIAIDRQHLHQVEQLLTALPRRTRQAFELYRMGGHTQREVADRLGVSITLVNNMIRDAVEALARCHHTCLREHPHR